MPRPRPFNDDELIHCIATGMTQSEAARYLGVYPETVSNRMRSLQMVFSNKHRRRKFTDDEVKLILAWAEGRMSAGEVARTIKCSRETIYRYASQHGVKVKKPERTPSLAQQVDERRPSHEEATDKLLARLVKVHGAPRYDIYPGLAA